MGRKVKLQDTGGFGDSAINYKAENGKYYTSENAYLIIKTNKEYRQKCIDKIAEVLDYQLGMKLPTVTFKKLNEFEVYGYDVVYETIIQQSGAIDWALQNKQFNQETAKIFYIMAIIQNNIMTEYKKKIAKNKQQDKKITTIDVEIEDIKVTSKQTKDISKWLEDE